MTRLALTRLDSGPQETAIIGDRIDFDQHTFLELIQKHTEVARNTLRVLAERLRGTNIVIDHLSFPRGGNS